MKDVNETFYIQNDTMVIDDSIVAGIREIAKPFIYQLHKISEIVIIV